MVYLYNSELGAGSRDTTLLVWSVVSRGAFKVNENPAHVLYGHNDEVLLKYIEFEIFVACVIDLRGR